MHSWRIQQWNCYFPLAVQTEDPPTKSFITIEIDLRKGKWRIAWKEKQKAEIREKWARKPLLKVLVFRFRILLLWKWWISKNATTKRFHKFIKSLCCCILISWKLKESSSVTKACQQRFFLNTHHPKKKKKKVSPNGRIVHRDLKPSNVRIADDGNGHLWRNIIVKQVHGNTAERLAFIHSVFCYSSYWLVDSCSK